MKKRYIRRKYKLQEGVDYLDTSTFANPDYQEAYDIRDKESRNKANAAQIGELGLMFVGAPPGLTRGILKGVDELSSSLTKDKYGNYRSKELEVLDTFANPVKGITKGIDIITGNKEERNQAAADLWSGSLGALGQKKLLGIKNPLSKDKILGMKNPFKKNPFGKTTSEKVKDAAVKEEIAKDRENILKWYNIGAQSSTEGQSSLAKKGKYKLKTGTSTFKQPRMIETEGREPIFSPEKADGTRDLLYYNPNDPTHEEGGVKAMVVPTAADGKKNTKANKKPEVLIDKDSWAENVGEIFDPTGIASWDDAYRALKNLKNDPKNPGNYVSAAVETLGALPLVGKLKYLSKTNKNIKKVEKAGKFTSVTDLLGDIINAASMLGGEQLSNEGYNPVKGTYKGRNIMPQYYTPKTAGMGAPAFQAGTSKIMSGRKHYEIPEIKPPTPYELMPKPPRSRFNKDSKKVKVYR